MGAIKEYFHEEIQAGLFGDKSTDEVTFIYGNYIDVDGSVVRRKKQLSIEDPDFIECVTADPSLTFKEYVAVTMSAWELVLRAMYTKVNMQEFSQIMI